MLLSVCPGADLSPKPSHGKRWNFDRAQTPKRHAMKSKGVINAFAKHGTFHHKKIKYVICSKVLHSALIPCQIFFRVSCESSLRHGSACRFNYFNSLNFSPTVSVTIGSSHLCSIPAAWATGAMLHQDAQNCRP